MSRYSVISFPEAENDLALLWMDEKDRGQITEAADTADRILAENPFRGSVYLSEQLRRIDVPPLRFYFEVRDADRVVEISQVVRLTT